MTTGARRPAGPGAAAPLPAGSTGTVAAEGLSVTRDTDHEVIGEYLSGFARAPRLRDRYEFEETIGSGSQGKVTRVYDRVLRRHVALKELLPGSDGFHGGALQRFVAEAQLTAQLAHPHIIPIYDAGITEEGLPYYTMPLLPRRTLENVLDALRAGDPAVHALLGLSAPGDRSEARAALDAAILPATREHVGSRRPIEYPRVALLRLFTAASLAMHAAHEQGVVHRDLKPSNLILGATGGLLVADFGLAALYGARLAREGSGGDEELAGAPLGTPLYMSPEQARGDLCAIGPASDVYSLGAILYEILTLRPPIEHESFLAQIVAIAEQEPIHPCARAPEREVPRDLGDLALRCLAKDPSERPTAAELVGEVDTWLEGSRERQRRKAEADRLTKEADQTLARLEPMREAADVSRAVSRAAWLEVPDHAPLEEKRSLWLLEDEARERENACERAERDAIVLLEAALRHVEGHMDARTRLSELHFSRMERRERLRDDAAATEEMRRAEQVGGAPMVQRIHAPARLRVVTRPAGVPWSVQRYVERQRQLQLEPVPLPRIAPRVDALLTPGSYLVIAQPHGTRPVVVPVSLARSDDCEIEIDTDIGRGLPDWMALVHGGPTLLGGDTDGGRAESARELVLPSFAMGILPITCAEYLEFLRALGAGDLYEALARAPRASAGAPPYWQAGDSGNIEIPERDEQGDVWDARFPVLGISALDAQMYLTWRSERDGLEYRLCLDHEWERAARGADGRLYPWGHHFDPSLCRMRQSRPGRLAPEAAGSFQSDVSPFGVRDLAGGIADWTGSPFRDDPRDRCIRGGAWSSRAHRCSATFRGSMLETDTSGDLGFRLTLDVPVQR